MCVYTGVSQHESKVRGQLMGVGALLELWVPRSSSNCQVWWQEPLPTELFLRSHLQNFAIKIHAQFAFVYGESVIKLAVSLQDFPEVHS